MQTSSAVLPLRLPERRRDVAISGCSVLSLPPGAVPPARRPNWWNGPGEPPLADLLDDPLLAVIMARDGVSRVRLLRMLGRVRRHLRDTTAVPGAEPALLSA